MLFTLNLMAGFWFVHDIVMTELQSGSERREREKTVERERSIFYRRYD